MDPRLMSVGCLCSPPEPRGTSAPRCVDTARATPGRSGTTTCASACAVWRERRQRRRRQRAGRVRRRGQARARRETRGASQAMMYCTAQRERCSEAEPTQGDAEERRKEEQSKQEGGAARLLAGEAEERGVGPEPRELAPEADGPPGGWQGGAVAAVEVEGVLEGALEGVPRLGADSLAGGEAALRGVGELPPGELVLGLVGAGDDGGAEAAEELGEAAVLLRERGRREWRGIDRERWRGIDGARDEVGNRGCRRRMRAVLRRYGIKARGALRSRACAEGERARAWKLLCVWHARISSWLSRPGWDAGSVARGSIGEGESIGADMPGAEAVTVGKGRGLVCLPDPGETHPSTSAARP